MSSEELVSHHTGRCWWISLTQQSKSIHGIIAQFRLHSWIAGLGIYVASVDEVPLVFLEDLKIHFCTFINKYTFIIVCLLVREDASYSAVIR